MDEQREDQRDYRELAAEIVAAYVSHNALSQTDLPKLLSETYTQLQALSRPPALAVPPPPSPAVPVGKSIKPSAVICLYCGQGLKSLKRHLASEHGVAPDTYRATFGLPYDYPMVAPDYSAARSDLAKKIGLGKKRPGS